MLAGRARELAELSALVGGAQAGCGATRWLSGDPGIGKTALLDELVATVPAGVEVFRVLGREAERELAWSGVGDLVARLVDGGHAASLSDVQQTSMLAALSRAEPDEPLEPYAVLTGIRDALLVASAETPILVVVDDAQWLDEPSLLTVEFLAPRCDGTRVAMAVAGRPDGGREPPVATTTVGPLDREAAEALLAACGVGHGPLRTRIVDELGANPLLLRAAAEALDADQRSGLSPVAEVLPVPPSVTAVAERRLAPLSGDARQALLVVAASPSVEVAVLGRALDQLGRTIEDLEPAEAAGLVELVHGEVRFSQPTVRSTVYHGASAAERRAAHQAVAAAVPDAPARAWHRGLGTFGADEEVAADLEATAESLLSRGAPLVAARHLEMAARLSPSHEDAARRLRRAAEAVLDQGRDEAAEALLDRADAIGRDRTEAVRRHRVRHRVALRTQPTDEVVGGLLALADEVAPDDPALAAEIQLDLLGPLVRAARPAELLAAAKVARDHAERAGDDRLRLRAEVAMGAGRVATGDQGGHVQLERHRDVLLQEGTRSAAPFLAEVVAPCLAYFHRSEEARQLFQQLEADLRAEAEVPVLLPVLAAQAILANGTSVTRAASICEEALELAEAVGRPSLALLPASCLAMATAAIGDASRCLPLVDRLLATGEVSIIQPALVAKGFLHLGRGEVEQALEVHERLAWEIGIGEGLLRWEFDWCEALIRARRPDEAAQVLEAGSQGSRALFGAGGFARVRGILAEDPGQADEEFAAAVAWFQLVGNGVGEGRTELAWGERLRRARRRAAAREHLERAVEVFDGLGAAVWADQARRELDAAGGSASGEVTGVEALTTQELDIARLASAGASNRDIGERLYISPRTVETHLGAVFRKLGVSNRRQLSALAVDEPRLRR